MAVRVSFTYRLNLGLCEFQSCFLVQLVIVMSYGYLILVVLLYHLDLLQVINFKKRKKRERTYLKGKKYFSYQSLLFTHIVNLLSCSLNKLRFKLVLTLPHWFGIVFLILIGVRSVILLWHCFCSDYGQELNLWP